MKYFKFLLLLSLGLFACNGEQTGNLSTEPTYDIVIYGATSGGIAAAVQAKRMGKSVLLIEPSARIGGLTTGGLGQTDIGNKQAVGGISREFYEGIKAYYDNPDNWKYAKISVINSKSGKIDTTTITPLRESTLPIYQNGEYWLEANILANDQMIKAYQIFQVNNISEDRTKPLISFDLPEKQIGIIAIIIVVVSIVGMYFRKN